MGLAKSFQIARVAQVIRRSSAENELFLPPLLLPNPRRSSLIFLPAAAAVESRDAEVKAVQ